MKRACPSEDDEAPAELAFASISTEPPLNPPNEILFAGGSAIEFSMAREAIISRFKTEKCWDLVKLPEDPKAAIVETPSSVGEEPTQALMTAKINQMKEVSQADAAVKIQALKEEISAEDPIHFLFAANVPNDHPEVQALAARLKDIEEKSESEIIKYFITNQWRRSWNEENDRWDKRTKQCGKVFRTSFSSDVLSSIREELDSHFFRAAWKKLHELYLTYDGDTKHASLDLLYQMLDTTKFDDASGSIPTHFANMKRLFDEGEKLGLHFDEDHRIYYICKSFSHSSTYSDVIRNAKLNKKTMDQLKAQILSVHGIWKAQNATSRLSTTLFPTKRQKVVDTSPSTLNVPPTATPSASQFGLVSEGHENRRNPSVVCQICQKRGHSAKQCYKIVPCSKCGKTGHPPFRCFYKESSSNSSNEGKFSHESSKYFKRAHLLNPDQGK